MAFPFWFVSLRIKLDRLAAFTHILEGNRSMSHLVSKHLINDRSIVFSEAMVGVLSGQDSRMRHGDVAESISDLFARGKTLDGAEPAGYELGQWKGRFMCDDVPAVPVEDNAYFAWVSTDFWDYSPNLAFFTETEFRALFVDCCRNYVAEHPDRREEFSHALELNGMAL